MNNYEIDGIHLDYIRYQDNFYGYNKYGIEEFENIFSINPIDIKRGIISTRFGYEQSYVDSMKSTWDQFKMDKITEFIRSIKYSIINDSLDLQLSAAVKPDILEAKFRWYQDWVESCSRLIEGGHTFMRFNIILKRLLITLIYILL